MVPTIDSNRKVRFLQSVDVKIIPQLGDYSDQELRSIYYNRKDYENFRKAAKKVIERLGFSAQFLASSRSLCIRGLEGSMTSNQNRLEASLAVFSEQLVQREIGVSDPS